jgi:hypothetical protein
MTPEQKARQQIDRQLEQTGWIVLVPQDPNDEPASVLLEQIRAKQAIHEGHGQRPSSDPPHRSKSRGKKA